MDNIKEISIFKLQSYKKMYGSLKECSIHNAKILETGLRRNDGTFQFIHKNKFIKFDDIIWWVKIKDECTEYYVHHYNFDKKLQNIKSPEQNSSKNKCINNIPTGLNFIKCLLEVVGVDDFFKLSNQNIRVIKNCCNNVVCIGNILENKWINISKQDLNISKKNILKTTSYGYI